MFCKIWFKFSQMVSNDRLLSRMIRSQNSFVMLWESCLHISNYIYPVFQREIICNDNLRCEPEIICNAVRNIYLFLPLISQIVSNEMLLSTMNSDFSEKSFVMLYVKNVCKYLFIFTPYFIKWCHTTCCCAW